MTKPRPIQVRCPNDLCGHHSIPFEWVTWASWNETVSGPMDEETARGTIWATCPECGTAVYLDSPDVQVWGW